ncbi:MAG TPA: hypothetical protein VF669_10270 [Tepidisphaeraceae bacterium]
MLIDNGCGGTENELTGPLKRSRHRVTHFISAEAAVKHLRHDRPDLVVLPVAMLGKEAMPIVAELADRRGEDWPAVALYWNQILPASAGGPNPFGSCWFVAQGENWEQTHQRLMACIEQACNPLAMPRQDVMLDRQRFGNVA